jgi:hypothetical protein
MTCHVCGVTFNAGQRFCSVCGTRVALDPPPLGTAGYAPNLPFTLPTERMPHRRIESHVRTLSILWCVYGCLRLLQAAVVLFVLHVFTGHGFGDNGWPFGGSLGSMHMLPFSMHALIPFLTALTVIGTALAFLTSYALLTRRSWGRGLALVAAVFALIKIPLGTGLGVYTLWVLAPPTAAAEYLFLSEQ